MLIFLLTKLVLLVEKLSFFKNNLKNVELLRYKNKMKQVIIFYYKLTLLLIHNYLQKK